MEISVQILGDPAVLVTGQAKPVSVKSLGRVVIFLALLRGASVDRVEMAAALWPGELPDVSANRLRVSLNRVRGLLGHHLDTDRERVRLSGIAIQVDVWEAEDRLREILDEVDHKHQLAMLAGAVGELQNRGWRQFLGLDRGGSLKSWDQICRTGLSRMGELAADQRDWELVDLAWRASIARGDFDRVLSEQFLVAHDERGILDTGFKEVRQSAVALEIDLESEEFVSVRNFWQKLRESDLRGGGFRSSHFQLLGRSMIDHVDRHADLLAELMTGLEVQAQMLSSPAESLELMDRVQRELEVGSKNWVAIEVARLLCYSTLYDSQQMIAIGEGLLKYELTPHQAGRTWMSLSFALFQLRRWDEAFVAIRSGQKVTREAGFEDRYQVGLVTEGAFLWHVGEVEKARAIYNDFLTAFDPDQSTFIGLNWAIVQSNYGVVELIFGDIREARRRVDLSFGMRDRINMEQSVPMLLCLMGVVFGRCGDIEEGVDHAVEGLKLTYWRGSSREGQINLEWTCGLIVLGGYRLEAYSLMEWVKDWRQRTGHIRSVAELRFEASLGLDDLKGTQSLLKSDQAYREVMSFTIKLLRRIQGRTC